MMLASAALPIAFIYTLAEDIYTLAEVLEKKSTGASRSVRINPTYSCEFIPTN